MLIQVSHLLNMTGQLPCKTVKVSVSCFTSEKDEQMNKKKLQRFSLCSPLSIILDNRYEDKCFN